MVAEARLPVQRRYARSARVRATSETRVVAAVMSCTVRRWVRPCPRSASARSWAGSRPRPQTAALMAMTMAPAARSVRRIATPTAAHEMAVRLQASWVRSRARPGSRSPPALLSGRRLRPMSWLMSAARRRREQGEDGGDDGRSGDGGGQDAGQARGRQRLAAAQGPLVAGPFEVAGDGDDGAQADQRNGEQVPAPRYAGERGQQLDDGQPGDNERQRGAVPGQERPLVGEGEPGVGLTAILVACGCAGLDACGMVLVGRGSGHSWSALRT